MLTFEEKLRYRTIVAKLAPLRGLTEFPNLTDAGLAVLVGKGINPDASYDALRVEVMVKPPPMLLESLANIDTPNEQQISAGVTWPPKS